VLIVVAAGHIRVVGTETESISDIDCSTVKDMGASDDSSEPRHDPRASGSQTTSTTTWALTTTTNANWRKGSIGLPAELGVECFSRWQSCRMRTKQLFEIH